MSRRRRVSMGTVSKIVWRSLASGNTAQDTRSASCSGSWMAPRYFKTSLALMPLALLASLFGAGATGNGKGRPFVPGMVLRRPAHLWKPVLSRIVKRQERELAGQQHHPLLVPNATWKGAPGRNSTDH